MQQTLQVARVQIDEPLRADEYRLVNELFQERPDLTFRAFGTNDELANLEFLRFLPDVKKFSLSGLYRVGSLRNLSLLSDDLVALDIGQTRAKLDLRPAARFSRLKQLRVEGHVRGLSEIFASNPGLNALSLDRIPLDRVDAMGNVPQKIESLALTLGSLHDSRWLASFADLRYLVIRSVKGLDTFDWLASMKKLEYLWLDKLSKLENLPDLAQNSELIRMDLTGLRGLHGANALQPILQASALEELVVTESRLSPDSFKVLKQKASLRRVEVSLINAHHEVEVAAMLQLDAPGFMGTFAADRSLIAIL
ncbi:hypothetical protein ACWDXH_14600 [Micromonospora chokoriensis]